VQRCRRVIDRRLHQIRGIGRQVEKRAPAVTRHAAIRAESLGPVSLVHFKHRGQQETRVVHQQVHFILSFVLIALSLAAQAADNSALKDTVITRVDEQAAAMAGMSDAIWAYAETALGENQSAELLADHAESQGFTVERGVAGMPTAFIASYGEGRPIIGIMGEYDALPRLSQDAVASRRALIEDAPGHGCGHNLFGVASLAAAVSIRELIEAGELTGTIRYYGTPAEESIGGKTYMARDGLFDDLDVALSWHPNSRSKVDVSGSQAMVETVVEFTGTASHAAYDPWNGRSALDGLELFTHALNLMREHVRPSVRIHYSIVDGGGAPNVVPATASAAVWIRDDHISDVMELFERAKTIAAGAAMAANVEAEFRLVSGTYNMMNNKEAAKVAHANLELLGPVPFTDAHDAFARELQQAMGSPVLGVNGELKPLDLEPTSMEGGSTDVADLSFIVPTIDISVAAAPAEIPWHSWGVVASSGRSIGHTGMIHAAKALAMTMVDFFTSPRTLDRIRAEFDERNADFTYQAYIPEGPPPVPYME
jgi:aminobenzoyl-glutamate utilization protein B